MTATPRPAGSAGSPARRHLNAELTALAAADVWSLLIMKEHKA